VRGLTINDAGKLLVVLVALVGGITLALVGAFVKDGAALLTAGTGLATLALGYTFGNGRLASRVEPPASMVSPVLEEHPKWVGIDELRKLAIEQKRHDAARAKAAAKPPRGRMAQ
jgi:hypothetical protein